ncbi:palmitoyl-protein thioesterase ABHD10, mitochondrial-like [Amphibalanus amphitrite]|uniref:palmitoyl-protein thioesterase ABHD10, mitochondrial-like n=1 Tax=Amphibalanus amphitrite TaxID=1232801 RepID=UPI001C9048C5|nr:palmitoyl-protein thioesterase ABHD10, mitochondrial-like [Amphibalanus amphitrite]
MATPERTVVGLQKSAIFRKHNFVETRYANLGTAGQTSYTRRLAFCKVEGQRRPGIIYIPGYFAPMNIAKANILEAFCIRTGRPFVKYDAEGVGQSVIPDAEEVSFTKWFEDACYVVEHLTDGPQMLVSSSNGAWMALLMASRYPDRIHSTLMIGPGVNQCMDDDIYEGILASLDKETAARVRAGKPMRFKANWVGEVTGSKKFLDEMKAFRITNEQLHNIKCPVRIVHATDDSSVLWDNSVRLMDIIGHQDVRMYLKKRGDHRMLADEDLHLLLIAVLELLDSYPVPDGPPAPPSPLTVSLRELRGAGVIGESREREMREEGVGGEREQKSKL